MGTLSRGPLGWEEEEYQDQIKRDEESRKANLTYVNQHVERERERIRQLNLQAITDRTGDRNCQPRNRNERVPGASRGGGYRGFRGRGRGRGRRQHEDADNVSQTGTQITNARSEPTESYVGRSVYGKVPEDPTLDADVFAKYDMNKRMFDTSHLVINPSKPEILEGLKTHQIMMIEGFTGCGKTTQVPQFILDDASKTGCHIAVTQPRRIAAISVASRVAAERDWKLGQLVGYQVGMSKQISEDTRLTYMTTGVLLQLLIGRKKLDQWTHIIIDEVHERDLETDLLLLVIKKIMVDTYNTSTKIILMSATLNTDKFENYFPIWKVPETNMQPMGPINIKVDYPNMFPIKEFYLEDVVFQIHGNEDFSMQGLEEPKLHAECYELAAAIIDGFDETEKKESLQTRGAVLIFLPGLLEIETLYKILTELRQNRAIEKSNPVDLKWVIYPLHSSITSEEQQKVFHSVGPGYRKIILATNIAESSITVPDIKYVIDFCLTKNLSCDPATNYTCLRLDWASKNQCIQRRGRCGRVSAGTVYRMVTKEFYQTLEQEASPEMNRSSLESVVLQVKLLSMGSPLEVLALAVDPPEQDKIRKAVANLKEIGALTILMPEDVGGGYDAHDGGLTFVGRVISHLPIDIRLGRLIILGHAFDCLDEAVIIAAGLSVKSPFSYPYSKRMEAYLSKQDWSQNSFSDCLALLNVYTEWEKKTERQDFNGWEQERKWSKNRFVQLTSLREMKVLIAELKKRLRRNGIETLGQGTGRPKQEQLLLLKVVIAGAFYPNYFIRPRRNQSDYQKEISKDLQGADPMNSVAFQGFPIEQPGKLYSKLIREYVSFGTSIPKFTYSGSKVIVSFDTRGDFVGPISSAVYRAIKMRQLRIFVSFPTVNRDEAYELLTKQTNELKSEPKFKAPSQKAMPSLTIQSVEAFVTHVETPSEFFVILKEDKSHSEKIASILKGAHQDLLPLSPTYYDPGQLCIVDIPRRNIIERARIDKYKEDTQELFVYCLDTGKSIWVERRNVLAVKETMRDAEVIQTTHALAFQCRLSQIKPAAVSGGIWSMEAVRSFNQYLEHGTHAILKIYSIYEGVMIAELFNSNRPGCKSINERLIENRFADVSIELGKIQENNNCRMRFVEGTVDMENGMLPSYMREVEDLQNKHYEPDILLKPPSPSDLQNQATLKGPHSPLEMHFNSMCNTAHYKQTIVDNSSLNSVALDQEPFNCSSRMLVAANVSIAHRTGHILARETTLMPPIPGICGLLAMLFCPKMELRVDYNYTAYTGCLTGLGIDPEGKLVYKDHDMEMIFDTVIDDEDVKMINDLRTDMNDILSEHISKSAIPAMRRQMRKRAMELLSRKRGSIEETWPDDMYSWNLISKTRLRSDSTPANERTGTLVFPRHQLVHLPGIPAEEGQRRVNNVFEVEDKHY